MIATLLQHNPALRFILYTIFGIVATAIYVAPSIVAAEREHYQYKSIVALNLLLGWTFLFWAAAMVWAFSNPMFRPEGES